MSALALSSYFVGIAFWWSQSLNSHFSRYPWRGLRFIRFVAWVDPIRAWVRQSSSRHLAGLSSASGPPRQSPSSARESQSAKPFTLYCPLSTALNRFATLCQRCYYQSSPLDSACPFAAAFFSPSFLVLASQPIKDGYPDACLIAVSWPLSRERSTSTHALKHFPEGFCHSCKEGKETGSPERSAWGKRGASADLAHIAKWFDSGWDFWWQPHSTMSKRFETWCMSDLWYQLPDYASSTSSSSSRLHSDYSWLPGPCLPFGWLGFASARTSNSCP